MKPQYVESGICQFCKGETVGLMAEGDTSSVLWCENGHVAVVALNQNWFTISRCPKKLLKTFDSRTKLC
jgi:hypothetical protein